MPRPLILAAWLFVWLSTPVVAQKVAETADSADVLVLDHDFGVVGELVRLFLSDKQVYRAELSTQDVTLELRPRLNGTQIPRVYPISDAKYRPASLRPSEVSPAGEPTSKAASRRAAGRGFRDSECASWA